MQIHRVRGRDLRDALQKARASLGANAVVLSHEADPDGAVTVSVTEASAKARSQASPVIPDVAEPGQRDVLSRLQAAGASVELMQAVLEGVRVSEAHGAFAIDEAAEVIARRMRVAPSPQPTQSARVIAFVGPTGAGKTATVAKLADRLTRAGRKIAVATLDSYRPGGADVLSAESERLGVPFTRCRYREDLATLLAKERARDAILLDTRGRSPRDAEHISQLASVLHDGLPGADLVTYLIVPAPSSGAALDEVLAGYARTKPHAAVVTKVDETRRTAVALEAVQHGGLPVAFLGTGQEVGTDFFRATPDRMADLILGGRVR